MLISWQRQAGTVKLVLNAFCIILLYKVYIVPFTGEFKIVSSIFNTTYDITYIVFDLRGEVCELEFSTKIRENLSINKL